MERSECQLYSGPSIDARKRKGKEKKLFLKKCLICTLLTNFCNLFKTG